MCLCKHILNDLKFLLALACIACKMAESRDNDDMRVVHGATGGRSPSTESTQNEAAAMMDELKREFANLANRVAQRPTFNFFLTNQYFGPVVQGDMHGNVTTTTNVYESQVDSVGGQSASQSVRLQSPAGMSEAELRAHQTDAFFHLLNQLNLHHFEQPIRGALNNQTAPSTPQQAIEQGNTESETIEASPADIDVQTEAVVKKVSVMKLDGDDWKLVEEAFIALIRDDESEKSAFDLITAYNKESASLPSEFYSDRQDLMEITTKFWSNHLLGVVASTSDRLLNDNNEMKRALARVCKALSEKLQEQTNDDFISRAGDVFKMGIDFASNKIPIHAVFSMIAAAELHILENKGDESFENIDACLYGTEVAVSQMENQPTLVLDYAIPLMRTMQSQLHSIDHATKDVRIVRDAWSLLHIGSCCFRICEYQLALSEFESARKLMEGEFEEKANKYRLYGGVLANIGISYLYIGNFPKARELSKLALEAFSNAEDWENDEGKKIVLDYVKWMIKRTEE